MVRPAGLEFCYPASNVERRTTTPNRRPHVSEPSDWVSPSDIATYTYCARAYWLERVRQVERTTRAAGQLELGQFQHAAHGRRVLLQRWLVRVAVVLLLGAVGLIWAASR